MNQQIAKLGTILGIWAHPDDEVFSMAGLMCQAVRNGQTVACLTATKGESGVQDESHWPRDQLADIRARELAAAYRHLGVEFHHWLDYADGGCKDVPETEACGRVLACIERYQPDSIFTFPPDGITGHDDHRAVSRWTTRAVSQSGQAGNVYYAVNTKEQYSAFLESADKRFNIYFNIDRPTLVAEADCDLLLDLDDEILDCKLAALKSMPSQTATMFADPDKRWLYGAQRQEAFVLAKRSDINWR